MRISAPAKINLNLRIHGKRDDGFHEIETLMLPVDLADEMEIERVESGIHLTCDDPSLLCGPGNLVHDAATAFFRATGSVGGVRIHLTKRIPSGAGLGGGSSDAAATLLALNALFSAGMDASRLEALAASLGSDVPWFVQARPAVCRGRGEVIESVEPPPPAQFLLLKPPFGIPTPWAYGAWSGGGPWPTAVVAAHRHGGHAIFNDFEEPVFRKYPLLGILKAWLAAAPGVLASGMSGSGSTLFALLSNEAEPCALAEEVRSFGGETLGVWHVQSPPDPAASRPGAF